MTWPVTADGTLSGILIVSCGLKGGWTHASNTQLVRSTIYRPVCPWDSLKSWNLVFFDILRSMSSNADHFHLLWDEPHLQSRGGTHLLKPNDLLSGDYSSDPLALVIHYHQRPVAILQYWNGKIFVKQVGLGCELWLCSDTSNLTYLV